jgi:hypothetical protein
MLFDIVEAQYVTPRLWTEDTDVSDHCSHPCNEKVSVVTDIGLRLQEGIQDLKLEEQLAPAREAVARTLSAGSTNFWKGVEGVKGRWVAQRTASSSSASVHSVSSSTASTPVEISKSEAELKDKSIPNPTTVDASPVATAEPGRGRTMSITALETKAALGAWGSGLGSFFSAKAARFSMPRGMSKPASPATESPPPPHDRDSQQPSRPHSNSSSSIPPRGSPLPHALKTDALVEDESQPKKLDNIDSELTETAL